MLASDRGVQEDLERRVRLAAFAFLEAETARRGEILDWAVLTRAFAFGDRSVPLLGASGIWKPEVLSLPISLTTAPPKPGKPPPYEDGVGADGLLRYRYQGTDPENHFNAGLREVFRRQLPVIYFLGVDKGRYTAFWPCFIVEDHPKRLAVSVALNDAGSVGIDLADTEDEPELDRAYARRLTLQRLHQAGFRVSMAKLKSPVVAIRSPHPSECSVADFRGVVSSRSGLFHAVGLALGGDDVGVVQEPVEEADGGGVFG